MLRSPPIPIPFACVSVLHPGPLRFQVLPSSWPSFPPGNTDHSYLVLGVLPSLLPLNVVFEEDQILQTGIQGPLYSCTLQMLTSFW